MLESLFNKVADLRYATLLKTVCATQVFSHEQCEIFKDTYLLEHLWWLRLKYIRNNHANNCSRIF